MDKDVLASEVEGSLYFSYERGGEAALAEAISRHVAAGDLPASVSIAIEDVRQQKLDLRRVVTLPA